MNRKDTLRRLRAAVGSAAGKDVFYRADTSGPLERYGNAVGEGGWMVDRRELGAESIVYTFGIGRDLSFDLDLVRRHDCTVHAFDPTPESLEWVRAQTLPGGLKVHELGVGGRDGRFDMAPPEKPGWVSMSALREAGDAETVSVPVSRLSTIMRDLGHDRVDLLKMDIEGSEYDVVDEILAHNLDVRQLLVEFHHRFDAIGPGMTRAAVSGLRAAGYALAFVSANMEDYTFLRPRGDGGGRPDRARR